MSEENKNLEVTEDIEQDSAKEVTVKEKKAKPVVKKANVFVRIGRFFVKVWKSLKKFLSDTRGELKKVVWTPKHELVKNSKLVIVTVVAVGIAVALIDLASSFIINTIAGWISIG